MKKFEYKSLTIKIEGNDDIATSMQKVAKKLNTLGKEGWELVNFEPYMHLSQQVFVKLFVSPVHSCILKREID